MHDHLIGRRAALTGGAVTALGLIGAAPALAAGAPPGGPRPSPKAGSRMAGLTPMPAATPAAAPTGLPALAAGEQSYTVFGADLTASTSDSTGAGIVYVGGLDGAYPTGSAAWLGVTCQVPVGSLITGADATINGNPRSGSEAVWCDYHLPASASGFAGTVAYAYYSKGSGVATASLTINKYYTGSEVYEVYLSSLTATSAVRGIRVRYRPPAGGLVPMTPVRIYDSGTSPVGTAYRVVQIGGKSGIPADATAVVLNVEVYRPTATGYVKVLPYGTDMTLVTQYFTANQIIANEVVCKLVSGKIQLKLSAGTARVFIYALGYFRS